MEFKTEKWLAQYKASAAKHNGGSSDGIVCLHATISYIRDGLIDDIGERSEEDKAFCATIRDCLGELFTTCQAKGIKLSGFASNASAASAACGLKSAVDKELMSL